MGAPTYDDLMFGPGELVVDDLMEEFLEHNDPDRIQRCAGLLDRTTPGRVYFFCHNKYVVIDVNSGTKNDTIAHGPGLLFENWPALQQARFGHVDAVLPNPEDKDEVYFVCHEKVALIHVEPGHTSDYVVDGPTPIADKWPSLRIAGFDMLDAILPNPLISDEAYFFSDTKCALIKIRPDLDGSGIIYGLRTILDEWPSLKSAGFETVDIVIPIPNAENEAYFFSKKEYVLVKLRSEDNEEDSVVNGPYAITDNWPSLVQANFF